MATTNLGAEPEAGELASDRIGIPTLIRKICRAMCASNNSYRINVDARLACTAGNLLCRAAVAGACAVCASALWRVATAHWLCAETRKTASNYEQEQ